MVKEIPRIIIQIGRNRNFSILEKSASHTVKCFNPECRYIYYDDDEIDKFVEYNYPKYYDIFKSFQYNIQRADFFRYLAIYHFGGFYFDLDVLLARDLKDLFVHQCVFPFEEITFYQFLREKYNMDWQTGNYAFGATPQHPFIGKVIENCIRAQREPTWVEKMLNPIPKIFRNDFYVLCSTGPGLISRTVAENPDLAKKIKVLFPENVCNPQNWGHFGNYGVHLAKGKWRLSSGGFSSSLMRFVSKRWFDWVRKRQLKESNEKGPKRDLHSLCV
ncbi:MAG: hypothetical protein KAI50_10570 [Desulfobacterales bacterium]|nr:hypothetical protein [Desulfobacterales bacterium]